MQASVREQVFRIVSSVFGCPVKEVDENTSPDTVANWDSLRHMKLMLALEEELGVQFTADQIVEMISVGLILAVLAEKSGAR
ncbi:MAG TPA: acyl carrier protein [Dehalococcoidia bacterium]|nr:acyl carrier protein [Dehalococcoidia bacterium]